MGDIFLHVPVYAHVVFNHVGWLLVSVAFQNQDRQPIS